MSEIETKVLQDEWTLQRSIDIEGAPDIGDEFTSIVISPDYATLTYSWSEDDSLIHVSLIGPRRLKSGGHGKERGVAHSRFKDLPGWLQEIVLEHAPEGWQR